MIPKMTNPLGQYWRQPNPQGFVFRDKIVEMSEEDFNQLAEYSRSKPSGVYAGKMWKSRYQQLKKNHWYLRLFKKHRIEEEWYLMWYTTLNSRYHQVNSKRIVINHET